MLSCSALPRVRFQSTLSMRRATPALTVPVVGVRVFQSTLSMRRATGHAPLTEMAPQISIHALHEESDDCCAVFNHLRNDFNPRSP